MWNSYAFVHYATMEEARRALEQSNGAMFLNRKLIVQLSTSRFRPQPKESNTSIPQSPKKLMIMNAPSSSSSIIYHNPTGGSNTIKQQQSTPLTQQYTYSETNYDMMTSNGLHQQSSSPIISENQNLYRSLSPLSQDMNNYYSQYSSIPIDEMTASSSSSLKTNHIKSNKNLKTDIGVNGEIPKLYCTNLPDNCKANDLQRLFSSFGHVIDCVILWDYYAFITYKTFLEAERALLGLNGFIWKDRRLIVEWSRASGRRQQQVSSSPTPQKLGSFGSEISTPPSPRTRPTTLLAHQSASNNQFYGNNSPKILSPLLPSPLNSQSPHHTFNQNLALMSIMQQQPYLHHHASNSYGGAYTNGNNTEVLSNDNQQIFDGLTNSSSNHQLDLSPFLDTNSSNTNRIFSSSSELNTPSSIKSISNVYQPSDIATLLEPLSSDVSIDDKSNENLMHDIKNTLPLTLNNVPPSCSSAAAAGVAALFQENLLSSLFNSFEPFSKLFSNDDQSTSSSTYYNHFSPLLTTAPDNSHYPMSYGHNISWH
ncbi:unnamed protein product [Rotaria sp. Silwood2]|nr:unnamed protein product [Rotaria sp. Silwood2]CAF4296608.1 unnamed protein product [Rotaria sp. Silwood2]